MTEELQELRISFKYNFEDFRKTFLSNYFTNKVIIFSYCLLPIMLGALIVYIIFNDIGPPLGTEELMFLILVIGLIAISIFRPFALINEIQQQWATSYQYNRNDITAIINNEGVFMRSILGEQNYSWTFIYKIIEQKEAFCIYLNSKEFKIIPKRVLEGKDVTIIRNIIIKNKGQRYAVQGFRKKKIIENELL